MAKLVLSPEMQAKVDEYIRAAEPERVARLRADAQRDPGELFDEGARLSTFADELHHAGATARAAGG